METLPALRYFLAGKINREYIITADGKPYLDCLGGDVLYAANGLALWESGIGILSKVSRDFPDEFIEKIKRKGFDVSGISRMNHTFNMAAYFAYRTPTSLMDEAPVTTFSRLNIPYSKMLLEMSVYQSFDNQNLIRELEFFTADEIPNAYLDASAVHLCEMSELSQSLLPIALKQTHVTTMTIDPAPSLMVPNAIDRMQNLSRYFTAIMTSEDKIKNLYSGVTSDVWEMAEDLSHHGCPLIVIKRGALGQYLYIAESHDRWLIPAYPGTIVNITGAGASFCGGFLAGYRTTYEPLEAALYGNISASFTVEGIGAFYAMDTLQDLAQARLNVLRQSIRKV